MNNILESNLSPTQEKTLKKQKVKTITSSVIDDNDQSFPIEISYDYTDYYGWDKWEISVWGYDYKINGEASISPKDLSEVIRDIIKEEEKCVVTFY